MLLWAYTAWTSGPRRGKQQRGDRARDRIKASSQPTGLLMVVHKAVADFHVSPISLQGFSAFLYVLALLQAQRKYREKVKVRHCKSCI